MGHVDGCNTAFATDAAPIGAALPSRHAAGCHIEQHWCHPGAKLETCPKGKPGRGAIATARAPPSMGTPKAERRATIRRSMGPRERPPSSRSLTSASSLPRQNCGADWRGGGRGRRGQVDADRLAAAPVIATPPIRGSPAPIYVRYIPWNLLTELSSDALFTPPGTTECGRCGAGLFQR